MMNLKFKRVISVLLVVAFLFSFSTPVFASALNVDNRVDVYVEIIYTTDEDIYLVNDEKITTESEYVEITPHNNLATAPPAVIWFLGLATNRIIAYLTPLVSSAVLNIARNNMSAIIAGVRNANSWTHSGVSNSVFRALRDTGVSETNARLLGQQIAHIIGLPSW